MSASHQTTQLTEISQVILEATIVYRLAQGWQVRHDGALNTYTQSLVPPAGDMRHDWCTKWFACNKLGIFVPWFAMQEDPEIIPGS